MRGGGRVGIDLFGSNITVSNQFRGWIKKLAIAIVAINLVLGLVLRFFYDDINGFLYRTVVWWLDLTGTLFYPAILVIIYLLFVGEKQRAVPKKQTEKKRNWY